MIYPDSRKTSLLGRATVQLSDDHQLYLEALGARAETSYILSPNPQRIRNLPLSVLPANYRTALTQPGLPTTFSGIRLRMTEAGNRSNEVTSDATRVVVGASGTLMGWDYDAALVRAENKATDKYVNGYTLFNEFDAGVRSGLINPFGASSQAGRDLIASLRVNDEAHKAKGVSTSIDAKLSRSLFKMDGGDAAVAVGAEFRREETQFTPSALLLSNNIAGDRRGSLPAGQVDPGLRATDNSRKVASLFGEFNAPFSKQLEAQFALRWDKYSAVGDTVNPKAGLRWQLNKALLVRASAGTGFRAPSLADLNKPTTFGTASSFLTDPQCAATNGIDLCTDQWAVERRSNPNLKPETSRQFSLGAVFEPVDRLSFTVDYWAIEKKDVISTLGDQIIVESPAKYNGTYIQRDSGGFISNILLQKENQGRLKTLGIDIGIDWRSVSSAIGRFGFHLQGTLVLEYDRQFGPQEPDRSNLGVFLNDQVIQRWRHRVSVDYDIGAFGFTLGNGFSSGYRDQNTTYDPVSNTRLPERQVKAYSLWDFSASWAVNKQLRLRAGVLNLLDTPPPFSNQAYYFLAGYDPTYTDTRGRTVQVSLNYSFK